MSEHRCATCGGPLSWAWEICPACHPEGGQLGGDITIHHGPDTAGTVVRFWCGRCHSEISGPAGSVGCARRRRPRWPDTTRSRSSGGSDDVPRDDEPERARVRGGPSPTPGVAGGRVR